jgi:hypothetical protein
LIPAGQRRRGVAQGGPVHDGSTVRAWDAASLKHHPELNERWLRNVIISDPAILGLGTLAVAAVERLQPGVGRLDLLLQQSHRRYVVELMLGSIDESHIVRGLEYWDQECHAHPEFEHWMVLVAEELGGRFHNVLRLLKSTVPLIALQLTALRVAESVTLSFTPILDDPAQRRDGRGGAPRRRRALRAVLAIGPLETAAAAEPTAVQPPASTLFPGNWPPLRK